MRRCRSPRCDIRCVYVGLLPEWCGGGHALVSLVCAAADCHAVLGQFDPTKRHLPFMGEGSCDAPVELENGYISVHCLGPKQTLAPGEVRCSAVVGVCAAGRARLWTLRPPQACDCTVWLLLGSCTYSIRYQACH